MRSTPEMKAGDAYVPYLLFKPLNKNENLEGNDKLMYEEFINNSCIKEYIVFIEEDTHIKEFMMVKILKF